MLLIRQMVDLLVTSGSKVLQNSIGYLPPTLEEELLCLYRSAQQGHYKQQLPPLSRHVGDMCPPTSHVHAFWVPQSPSSFILGGGIRFE